MSYKSFIKETIQKPVNTLGTTDIQEGLYPSSSDEVIIDYKLKSSDHILEERLGFRIQLGTSRLTSILEEAIQTMQQGEESLFRIPSNKLYPKGFPCNKTFNKDSEITFHVKLLEFKEYQKLKYEMTPSELTTFAEAQKKLGVEAFSKGNFYDAISKFEEASAYLSSIPSTEMTLEVKSLLSSLLVNLANAFNRIQQFSSTIVKATEALRFKQNPKAYYFRAVAYASLGNSDLIEKALEDYSSLQMLVPKDDPGVLNLYGLITAKRDEYAKSQKSLFKSFFKKGNVYDDLKKWTIPNEVNKENDIVYLIVQIGDILNDQIRLEIELFNDVVPLTCKNFLELCKERKYKNSIFHRLRKGYRLEGGDYENSNGTGGKSIYGGYFKDENFNYRHTQRGLLSMLNDGEDTNSSKFCIMLDASELMDNKNVVFGRVINGFDLLGRIEDVECDSEDKPLKEIRIVDCGLVVEEKKD